MPDLPAIQNLPVIHVCTTCRAGLPLAEGQTAPGRIMYEAVDAGLALTPVAELREVVCLSSCDAGCAAAISAPGKWTYLLGRLDPSLVPDLLAYAATYAGFEDRNRAAVETPGLVVANDLGADAGSHDRHSCASGDCSVSGTAKIPATVITGFLGAGKTTLLRHVIQHARGRRLGIMVNEFGAIGVDTELLKGCGIPECEEADIVELANGCLCCTVADEFLPAIEAMLNRPNPPEHIVIETSGLALPKPLLKAFGWPSIRSRVTVDGVIAVVDGPALAGGQFADDPAEVARQRASDPNLDHDNPLAEVYEDQLQSADLVVLNKADLLDAETLSRLLTEIATATPQSVHVIAAHEGKVDPAILLGLHAAAEDDLASRKSHHDAEDGEHEHDDFESFVVTLQPTDAPDALMARLKAVAEMHKVLRIKGFADVAGKPFRLAIQGVGGRFRQQFDRAWRIGEDRNGHVVVIGQTGLDRAAIEAGILGSA